MFIFQSYNWGEKPAQKKENTGKSIDDLPGSVPVRSHASGSVGASWGKEENHQTEPERRPSRRGSIGSSWGENREQSDERGADSGGSIGSSWGRAQKKPQGDESEQTHSDRGWGNSKGEKKAAEGMQDEGTHEAEGGENLPSSTPGDTGPATSRRQTPPSKKQENEEAAEGEETEAATGGSLPSTTPGESMMGEEETQTETPNLDDTENTAEEPELETRESPEAETAEEPETIEAPENETTEEPDAVNSSVITAPSSGLSRFIYAEDEENAGAGGSLESGETNTPSSQNEEDGGAPIPPPMSLRGRGKRVDDFERALLADHAYSYNFKA